MSFENLGLIEPILRALKEEGYEKPTPIQEKAIPYVLAKHDLLACAQTGTGKTAAFAIPIIQGLSAPHTGHESKRKPIRALVLTPTRELAIQVADSFSAYGRHTHLRFAVIFGGVSQRPQEDELRRGVDILIATPGRLLDLLNQRILSLSQVEIFVLDEADRMLDMGFIHDVRKVLTVLPKEKQNLLFSATMPDEIVKLASSFLHQPKRVEVAPVSSTAERITQKVYFVDQNRKNSLLLHVLNENAGMSALVFTRTKHGANKVAKKLMSAHISAEAIHGNKSQNARQAALSNFKSGKTRVLVATDIAARGIDIEELPLVINFELPNIPETYVHRIGRTGRAEASGTAISFCAQDEWAFLRDIQKLIRMEVEELTWDSDESDSAYEPFTQSPPSLSPGKGRGNARPQQEFSSSQGQQRGASQSQARKSSSNPNSAHTKPRAQTNTAVLNSLSASSGKDKPQSNSQSQMDASGKKKNRRRGGRGKRKFQSPAGEPRLGNY